MSALDLAEPIRDALVAASTITSQLTAYKGSYPIFTRRPAPADAPKLMIMVSPDVAINEQDGINDFRPIQERDVTIYGLNDNAANYRKVETLGYLVRKLFHSERNSISVPAGWNVIQITARGPIPAPVDDDQSVARLVMLRIELASLTG